MCKCGCGKEVVQGEWDGKYFHKRQRSYIKGHYWVDKKKTMEQRLRQSKSMSGQNNPAYKHDNNIKYAAIHNRMRRLITKPSECQKCGKSTKLDLANISHKYLLDPNDWMYTCRSCNSIMDKVNVGRKYSDERKQRIRESMLGSNNHFYGRHHSEESKLRISMTKRGYWRD